MLGNLDIGKLLVLLGVALIVLGPERLPKLAADAGRLVRSLRRLAQEATGELKGELAPHLSDLGEIDLSELQQLRRLRPLLDRYLGGDEPGGAVAGAPVAGGPGGVAGGAGVAGAPAGTAGAALAAGAGAASDAGAAGGSGLAGAAAGPGAAAPPPFDPEAT